MKKQDIIKTLKAAWIDFEFYWNQKDKDCSNYRVKLIKDKYTSLRTNFDFNIKQEELEDIIQQFKKFDYREYMKTILHNN